jgi:uncharacterized membrane protein YhaH (DUF805 family)
MDFAGAIKAGLQNWNKFHGTASKAEFWYFYLFLWIVGQIVNLVDLIINPALRSSDLALTETGDMMSLDSLISYMPWVAVGVSLITFVPSLSITFRRIQDSGRNGRLAFLQFIPLTLLISFLVLVFAFLPKISAASESDTSFLIPGLLILATAVLGILSSVAWFILWLIWMLAPSKSAAQGNQYVK